MFRCVVEINLNFSDSFSVASLHKITFILQSRAGFGSRVCMWPKHAAATRTEAWASSETLERDATGHSTEPDRGVRSATTDSYCEKEDAI